MKTLEICGQATPRLSALEKTAPEKCDAQMQCTVQVAVKSTETFKTCLPKMRSVGVETKRATQAAEGTKDLLPRPATPDGEAAWRCLREHMISWKCPKCPKSFRRAQDRDRHVCRHGDEKPYRCTDCGKTFCTVFELDQHTPTHTGERKYACPCCPYEFSTRSTLHNHMRTHSSQDRRRFRCSLCPAKFKQPGALKAHKRTHSDQCPHRCDVCGWAFSQKFNLLRHLQVHEREKAKGEPLPCPNCSKVCYGKELLEAHRKSCGNFHKCSNCGKGFVLEADLKHHISLKHGSPSESSKDRKEEQEEEDGMSWHAQGCEVWYSSDEETEESTSDLDTSNTQPAAAKDSQWNVRLKSHGKENKSTALKRPHATLRHYDECSEMPTDERGSDNEQSSSTAAAASQTPEEGSKHRIEGTAVGTVMKRSCPRYSCPVCKNSFDEWDALKSHTALEHKKKLLSSKYLFQCHLCDKTFTQNSNLKTHLKSHDRVVSFTCDVCGEGFALKHHLKRHKDRKHSVES